MVAYGLGDLADKLTIYTRKDRISKKSFSKTLGIINDGIQEYLKDLESADRLKFHQDFCKLADLNNAIWDLEYAIRIAADAEFPLETIGRRALEIRDLNSERVALINEINRYSKSGFQDVKMKHVSA